MTFKKKYEHHGSPADETLRDKSIRKAKEESETGSIDRPNETVSYGESQHTALRAEREAKNQPKTREYGHSETGRRNDQVAYEHFVNLREMLGSGPMSEDRARIILEGE